MVRLVIKDQHRSNFYDADVTRIKKVFEDRGYEITRHDAYEAWDYYSSSMCAGWMGLPKDDQEIFYTCMDYLIDKRYQNADIVDQDE